MKNKFAFIGLFAVAGLIGPTVGAAEAGWFCRRCCCYCYVEHRCCGTGTARPVEPAAPAPPAKTQPPVAPAPKPQAVQPAPAPGNAAIPSAKPSPEATALAAEMNRRGLEHYREGLNDQAISEYNEAVRLNPNLGVGYYNRGVALVVKKDFVQAQKDFSDAIRLNAAAASAYKLRGIVGLQHTASPNFDEVLDDFRNAVKLNPKDLQSHSYLAYVLSTCPKKELRDGSRAVEHALEACKLTEFKNSEQLLVLSAASAQAGDYDRAVQHAQQAVDLAPVDQKDNCRTVLAHFQQHLPAP